MFKIAKWKEWKNLYEHPDTISYLEDNELKTVSYNDYSVSFTLDNNNKAVVDFKTNGNHSTMTREYDKKGLSIKGSAQCDFSGRLWLDIKIISFWITPKEQKDLQKHLEELDQDLRDKGHIKEDETIFNSGWRVENYRDDNNNGYGEMEYKSFFYTPKKAIPLEHFTQQDFDPELYKVHIMNAKQKEEYYKKNGKTKGFGSNKTAWDSNTNNIAWRQAKIKSEKLKNVKSFKLFEKINK